MGKTPPEPSTFQKYRETPEYLNLLRISGHAPWSFHPWFPKDRTLLDALYSMIRDDKAVSELITAGILPARVPSPYGKPITLFFDSRVLIHDLNLREGALNFITKAALRWEVVIFYKYSWVSEIIDPGEEKATYSIFKETYPEIPTIGFKSIAFINRPPETTIQLEAKAEHCLYNPNNVLVISPPMVDETTIKDLDDMLMWMSDKMVDEKVPAYRIIPHFQSILKDAPTLFKEKKNIWGYLESIK